MNLAKHTLVMSPDISCKLITKSNFIHTNAPFNSYSQHRRNVKTLFKQLDSGYLLFKVSFIDILCSIVFDQYPLTVVL